MGKLGWWSLVAVLCIVSSMFTGTPVFAVDNGDEETEQDSVLISGWYRAQRSIGNTSHDVPDHASAIDATFRPNESWNARLWADPSNGEMNELYLGWRSRYGDLKFGRAYMPLSYLGYPRDQLFIEDTLAEKILPVFDTGVHFETGDDKARLSIGFVNGTGLRSDNNGRKDQYFRYRLRLDEHLVYSIAWMAGRQPDGGRATFVSGLEWTKDGWYAKTEFIQFRPSNWWGANPWSWYAQVERAVNTHWRLGARFERAKLEPGVYSRKEITSLGASYVLTEWSRFQLMYFTDRTVNGGKNEEGVHFALQIHF